MKKVKENKLKNLYPVERINCLSKNSTMLLAIGLLGLSPVFAVARATASDVTHLMNDRILVVDIVQQDRKITGTVNDQQGISVPGAAVQVKGTTIGTVTDIDGTFELEVPSGAGLVVSYIGMHTEHKKRRH